MKINMWKLLFAALIASTAMVACKDERKDLFDGFHIEVLLIQC